MPKRGRKRANNGMGISEPVLEVTESKTIQSSSSNESLSGSMDWLPKDKKKRGRPSKLQTFEKVRKSNPNLAIEHIEQTKYEKDLFLPIQKFDYPNWKPGKIESQELSRKQYFSNDLIPFYNTTRTGSGFRPSNEIIDLDDLRSNIRKVDIAVEKPKLLTKSEKDLSFGSFGGQNIQAKTDGQIYRGLYFQDGRFEKVKDPDKAKDENFVKHFFIADTVKVDADDTGYYLAYMNELYTGHKANHYFFGGKEGEIDKFRANRFFAKQIISSLSFQRNKAIQDALELSLSEVGLKEEFQDREEKYSPLAYRNSSGKVQDLSVSEEQLAICNAVFDQDVKINVDIVDSNKNLKFNYEGEDLDETKAPILKFYPDNKGEIRELDSDTLLKVAVERLNIEPDSAQNLLEGLYQQGWINYPRADTIKATDEPIRITRPIDKFQGTDNERKLLNIIDQSEKAVKSGKPYIETGEWELIQGKTVLKTSDSIKFADEPSSYDDKQFDITISKGIDPLELTNYLINNEIATPATRTAILASLKEAGIIYLDKDRKYQLDRRGAYFAGAFKFLEDNNIELGLELKREIDQAKTISELQNVINRFDVVERYNLASFIKTEGENILNEQNDLAVLESY